MRSWICLPKTSSGRFDATCRMPRPIGGHAGVRELASGFEDVLDEQWYTPKGFIQAGQEIVVPLRWGGRGKGSGVPFEERDETWIFSVRKGKVRRVREYGTKQAALEAVGLSEQDAHVDS
jgi:ketosteroid isomerase-like protein